jgi:hypothetical protein
MSCALQHIAAVVGLSGFIRERCMFDCCTMVIDLAAAGLQHASCM